MGFLKRNRSFSLVEILVSIVILAILVSLSLPQMAGMQDMGKKSRAEAELKMVQQGITAYYAQSSPRAFPASLAAASSFIQGSYQDPFSSDGTADYRYVLSANGKCYLLLSLGPNLSTGALSIDGEIISGNDEDDIYVKACASGAVKACDDENACLSGTCCEGSCVDTDYAHAHCGSCGNACALTQSCLEGVCSGLSSVTDTDNCQGIGNACSGDTPLCCASGCKDGATDENNCGSCGNVCPGGQNCYGGSCLDCGADTYCSGVCVDITSSDSHCGACGTACGEHESCVDSSCACDEGYTECDDACRDLTSDADYCGDCETACAEGQSCLSGVCCDTGYTNCSGVCRDLDTDDGHCGTCDAACDINASCDEGECACDFGYTGCSGVCRNLLTDNSHCGACDAACAGGESCSVGMCCTTGLTNCSGVCQDLQTDDSNCGTCGNSCSGGKTCTLGACACPVGQTDCSGACTNLQADDGNCGACGNECEEDEACSDGVCTPIGYTVTYDGNENTGGSVPTDATLYDEGATVTVLANESLVTGHTFAGWSTAADSGGTDYAPDATFSMGAANVTLYAKWTVNTYTITYAGNNNTGGTVPVDGSSPYNYNTTVTGLENTGSLVRTDYTFDGWNTAADGSGTTYAAGSGTFSITADTTLYAKWTVPDPCEGTPAIGTVCTGGALYAGTYNGRSYMVTPGGCSDAAEPTCAGGADSVTKIWMAANLAILGMSTSQGEVNEPLALAADPAAPAVKYCADMVYGGYDDWFLPATLELKNVLYVRSGGTLVISGVQDATYYWASNHASQWNGLRWSSGSWAANYEMASKQSSNLVRCLRLK